MSTLVPRTELSHWASTLTLTLLGEEGWSVNLWWIPASESRVRFLLPISHVLFLCPIPMQLWHSLHCSAWKCVLPCHRKTGKFYSHFSSSLSPGLRGNALFHFLLFVQLGPYLPALNNNTPPYLRLVQCVTSSRTKQTAAFPKTWIVFKKFRLASCLESPS